MSTEHVRGVAVWLPSARSVMRELDGSLRYRSLNGRCRDFRSMKASNAEGQFRTHAARERRVEIGAQRGEGRASRGPKAMAGAKGGAPPGTNGPFSRTGASFW